MPSAKNTLIKPHTAISRSGSKILFRKYNCVFRFAFAGMLLEWHCGNLNIQGSYNRLKYKHLNNQLFIAMPPKSENFKPCDYSIAQLLISVFRED